VGVLWRVEGLDKSGKTNVAVILAMGFLAEGYPVFTNMQGCTVPGGRSKGERWATNVKLDDLLDDIQRPLRGSWAADGKYHPADCDCPKRHAEICNGVFILDEAHTMLDPRRSGSSIAGYLTSFMMQAGKRNLLVLYTTHASFMVMPFLRELTSVTFKCVENREKGRFIYVDCCDENEVQRAIKYGKWVPQDKRHVFFGFKAWNFYDAQETIDPFAYAQSKFAGRSAKALGKMLALSEQQADGSFANPDFASQMQRMEANILSRVASAAPKKPKTSIVELMGNMA
jgi:hypothetical protein